MAYDTITFTCPCCGNASEEQIGHGDFEWQNLENISRENAERLCDPERKVYCMHCNERVEFERVIEITVVAKKWEPRPMDLAEELRQAGYNTDMSLEEALKIPALRALLNKTMSQG